MIFIDDRPIDTDQGVFIVAELSANHNQDFDCAIETIRAAKEAGADAIKLQTYTADTITLACDNEYFRVQHGTIWDGETLHSLYEKAHTPWEWHVPLKAEAERLGLLFFSSPFDQTAIDLLESLSVPVYKIASPEITDVHLIRAVAATGKPVILSTGIATLSDIESAIEVCHMEGNDQIILLKCVSAYPTPMEQVNLKALRILRETFNVVVGLSDHTLGSTVAIAAVALGACMIEKHFILDRAQGGPDAAFSMEPNEFKSMVTAVRDVESALGHVAWSVEGASKTARDFSRSLFVCQDLVVGDVLTKDNVRSIRPGYGLHPKYLEHILGSQVRFDIAKGSPLSWDMIVNVKES